MQHLLQIGTLLALLQGLIHTAFAQTLSYAEIEAMRDDTAKAFSAIRAGDAAFARNQLQEARQFYTLAQRTGEAIGDIASQAKAYYYLGGRCYRQTNDMAARISHMEKAVALYRQLNDMRSYTNALSELAFEYQESGDIPKAIDITYQSMAINDSLHIEENLVLDYQNLGDCYFDLQDFPLSLRWNERALAKAKAQKDIITAIELYNVIGTTHQALGQLDKAETNLQECLRLIRSSNIERADAMYCMAKTNLGQVYLSMKQFEKARATFKWCLQESKKMGLEDNTLFSLLMLGRMETEAQQYGSAKQYLEEARQLAEKDVAMQMNIAEQQAILFEKMGDTIQSNSFLKTYALIKDSLYSPSYIAKIGDIKSKYEIKLKNKEIETIRMWNSVYAGVALGITGILLLGLYALRQRNRRLTLETEQQRIRAEMDLAEQTALTELRESELRYAGEMLASKNQLLLNLRELMAQNAAGNTRKLRDDLGALISAIQADLAPQPTAARPEEATAESINQLDILLPGFLERMQAQYPALSRNELRLAAYIRLGYSTRDIAALLSIEIGSVEVARYRLRKKLPLPQGSALGEFLENI